jgi:hypothetical protein
VTEENVGTHLGGEFVQLVSLDGVDGHRVVGVDGSETSRDCIIKALLLSFKPDVSATLSNGQLTTHRRTSWRNRQTR